MGRALAARDVPSTLRSRFTIVRGDAVPSSRPRIDSAIASPATASVAATPMENAVIFATETLSPVRAGSP
jgi:hypothetical protein